LLLDQVEIVSDGLDLAEELELVLDLDQIVTGRLVKTLGHLDSK
jgi:hypothetical protein